MKNESLIYWDYNASAPIRPEVAALLGERLSIAWRHPGNASSVHQAGRAARNRLEDARGRVARILGTAPREICFTASGSEANALALKGAFFARPDKSRFKILSSRVEHPALLSALSQLAAHGAKVEQISPGPHGRIRVEDFMAALDDTVALCSLMWANNETGVVQPVEEVGTACRERGILFHTDAVQAVGKLPVSLSSLQADLLSLSAHKFGGPPGVGVLAVRRGVDVEALSPGHQEDGRRGGTANGAYAEALALALELSTSELEASIERIGTLRDHFEQEVLKIPDARINGVEAARVANTSNVFFENVDGEALLIALDLAGICASSGAACASGSLSPSHVLLAMGLSAAQAHGSVRFSLGPTSTEAEVERVVEVLRALVPKLQRQG